MRLFLIRHGQTRWNVEGRAQGHTDIPLDEHGDSQAALAAKALARESLREVLSSDLQRSSKTAKAIAESSGAPLVLTPDLRERNIGDWEGQPYRNMWASIAELESLGTPRELIQAPNGESIRDVWERLENVAGRLFSLQQPTAVVTHGGAGSLLLARLLKGTMDTARSFRLGNCAITELERRHEDGFVIVRYNDVRHLAGMRVMEGNLEGTAS